MELANPQILKSLLNYTSSRENFVAIQFLFMASLMFHEQELFVSRNANELRNGFLPWCWYCSHFDCSLRILYNRSGNFYPIFLGLICYQSEEHSRQFNFLYIKVGATEQIGEISDSVYSKQKVSRLVGSCREDVELQLGLVLSSYYLDIYINVTFIATHRNKLVSKRVYYTILEVLEVGSREALTVVNHLTHSFNWFPSSFLWQYWPTSSLQIIEIVLQSFVFTWMKKQMAMPFHRFISRPKA